MAQVVEAHGFFNFADDLFDDTANVKTRKIKVDEVFESPKLYEGWFMHKKIETSPKFELQKLKNTVEYLYFKKQYAAALEVCLQIMQNNIDDKSCIIYREMLDTTVRCHLKLGNVAAALQMLEELLSCSIIEPGSLYFAACVNRDCGRIFEASLLFVRYLKMRPTIYHAWLQLAECLNSANATADCLSSRCFSKAACIAAKYGVKLDKSTLKQLSTDFPTFPDEHLLWLNEKLIASIDEELNYAAEQNCDSALDL